MVIKTRSTESRCVIGPENLLFLRCVHASSGPEILQTGAVKGLKQTLSVSISISIFLPIGRDTCSEPNAGSAAPPAETS